MKYIIQTCVGKRTLLPQCAGFEDGIMCHFPKYADGYPAIAVDTVGHRIDAILRDFIFFAFELLWKKLAEFLSSLSATKLFLHLWRRLRHEG